MIEQKISASDRDGFFTQFSRAHSGAPVTLRVAAKTEVVDQTFRGVSSEGDDLIIQTGDGGALPHLGHRVDHVTGVQLEQTDEGADAALVMTSEDGTRTEIRFRWPLRADLMDPAVE